MKDVNQTRYHLLLGEADWDRSQTDTALGSAANGRRWEYDRPRQGIRLQAEVFTFQQQGAAAVPLDPHQRRDSDRDAYGHWYWIDPSGNQIRARWAGAEASEILYPNDLASCPQMSPTGDFRPAAPAPAIAAEPLAGLAVITDSYLVVGSPTTGSLLAFDLYALESGYVRVPLPQPDPSQRPQPFDLAALPNGGLLVLDRVQQQIWRLDRRLRPMPLPAAMPGEPTLFQPQTGPTRRTVTTPPAPAIALAGATVDPIAIAPLPDGSFWVLDQPATGASVLWHYGPDGSFPQSLELVTANLVNPEDDDLDLGLIRGYDLAYQPQVDDRGGFLATGTLFIVDQQGNQAFALDLVSLAPLTLRIQRHYYPLRSLDPVSLVATWSEAEVYYHQTSDRWLPIKALPRQRYEPQASLVLPSMDGREPDCLWHRLCIDACLPPETEVRVEARAAAAIANLPWENWQIQPVLYQRPSSEVPYGSLWSEADRADPHTGTWELLLQQVRGRYLQLRLTLVGNGRSSPLVRSLRAHYPRFSYLRQYLPAVYQQDSDSESFLDRFLANPEGVFTTLEGLIAQVQTLFDVRTVPSEALEWLASWIGLALEPGWSDYQRRLLIAQAPYFFQRRGTQVGLLQAILLTLYPEFGPRLFQDDIAQICPTVRIVERFLTRTQTAVAAGDPTELDATLTGDVLTDARDRAHRFTVLLPTTLSATAQSLVERIVTLEKPAHTDFTIKQYWALFRVGEVRLGLDTVLGQGGQFDSFRLGQSALAEAALTEAFPYTLTNRTVISR